MKTPVALCLALCTFGCTALPSLHAQTGLSFELISNNTNTSVAYASGDFNQDGKQDLISFSGNGYGSNNSYPILALGNGDGTFKAPTTIGTTHNGITEDVAVGDVNGDGHLDVVVIEQGQTTTTNYVDLYFGNGDGTFQPVQSFPTAYYPRTGTIGKFSGSGYLDIAVGDLHGNVEFFKNTGGKTFTPGNVVNLTSGTDQVYRVRAGNINDNGTQDLAATTNGSAFVLWNDGKGNFSPVLLGTYNVPIGSVSLTVGDINQDGNDDILVSYNCGGPTVQAGHGPGTICTDVEAYYAQGNSKTFHRTALVDTQDDDDAFYIADTNGDGIADLVTYSLTSHEQDGMGVYLGHPDGSFDQTAQVFVGAGVGVPGDFNRDGKIDFGAIGGIAINATPTAPCATSQISPTVIVCAPVNNTYLPSSFRVQATAYDTKTVTALQEYLDGKLVYNQPVTSFNLTETGAVGGHLLVTKAFDASGVSFHSNRYINVFNGTPGATCPATLNTASICLPGTTSASPVHILANAASAAYPTAVQLYVDNNLTINNNQGYSTAIDQSLTLAPGSHYLVFKMFDANGGVYTASKTVTVQ